VPGQVTDLVVVGSTDTTATLRFTEVSDGLVGATDYEMRYALSPSGWGWGGATAVTRATDDANVRQSDLPFSQFEIAPTWGGTGMTKPQAEYIRFDQIYLSR
jgi:hypothetical protein